MEGRNFTALTALSPLQGKNGSFGGQRSSSTNVTMDGVNARSMYTNGAVGNTPIPFHKKQYVNIRFQLIIMM
jgi:hypothetical protein